MRAMDLLACVGPASPARLVASDRDAGTGFAAATDRFYFICVLYRSPGWADLAGGLDCDGGPALGAKSNDADGRLKRSNPIALGARFPG